MKSSLRTILFISVMLLSGSSMLPESAYAQSRSSRSDDDSSSYTSRGLSSSARRAVEKLDEDPVERLPIPILFGISVSDLFPNFGDPRGDGTRTHEGFDIMAPEGAFIVSPTDAVVTRTGTGSSAGKYVYTANPGGETYVYMHLDEIADIKTGTVLKAGDLIGYVGNTGNASGGAHHLHFEIRDGRTPLDPYARFVREFTTEERVEASEQILEDADDEDEALEMLLEAGRGVFMSAKATGIDLPKEIEVELQKVVPVSAAQFSRDLEVGARGTDVTVLQNFLISRNAGTGAQALALAGATGYFGAVTKAALAEFQTTQGIVPAAGYFGPVTRARVIAL